MSMYLAQKYRLGTLFLCLLLEMGLPFYVVIRAIQRSSHLQGKGSTFISQSFLRPWVLVWSPESNLQPPALQSSALVTELILLGQNDQNTFEFTHFFELQNVIKINSFQYKLKGAYK